MLTVFFLFMKKLLEESADKALESQKEKNMLLLGTGGLTAKSEEILSLLGLNEHIIASSEEKGKIIELEQLKEQHKTVTTVEKIEEFCLKFNYMYRPLKEYKGPLPSQLVDIIGSLDHNFKSDAVADNLYILAPLEYFQKYDKKDIIKKRLSQNLEQVLLLEKVSDPRKNSITVFKTIDEVGVIRKFKRLLKAELFSSNYMSFYNSVFAIFLIVSLFLVFLMVNTSMGIDKSCSYHVFSSIIIVALFVFFLFFSPSDWITGGDDVFRKKNQYYVTDYTFHYSFQHLDTQHTLKNAWKYCYKYRIIYPLIIIGILVFGTTYDAKNRKVGETWTEARIQENDKKVITDYTTYTKVNNFQIKTVSKNQTTTTKE